MKMHRCIVAAYFMRLMCKITNVASQAVIDDRGLEGADLEYGVRPSTCCPCCSASLVH